MVAGLPATVDEPGDEDPRRYGEEERNGLTPDGLSELLDSVGHQLEKADEGGSSKTDDHSYGEREGEEHGSTPLIDGVGDAPPDALQHLPRLSLLERDYSHGKIGPHR
jgi:hypothetical protein